MESLISRTGLPDSFGLTILLISLILALGPWLGGADFGLFKVPAFSDNARLKLRVIGPLLLVIAVVVHLPLLEARSVDTSAEPVVGEAGGAEPSDTVLARNFVRHGSFPIEPPTEFVLSPQDFGLRDTTGFLTLVDAAFGTATQEEHAPNIFRLELRITNTTSASLHLDLTSRFFTLEDDRGRRATFRYFCCRAQGELLAPGQVRSVLLFFHSSDWYGKSIGARRIFLKVTGLLPVERATWEFPVLATLARRP